MPNFYTCKNRPSQDVPNFYTCKNRPRNSPFMSFRTAKGPGHLRAKARAKTRTGSPGGGARGTREPRPGPKLEREAPEAGRGGAGRTTVKSRTFNTVEEKNNIPLMIFLTRLGYRDYTLLRLQGSQALRL